MKAYIIRQDLKGIGDRDFFGVQIPYEKNNKIASKLIGSKPHEFSENVVVAGDWSYFKSNDYPYTDLGNTLFSCEMYRIMTEIGLPTHLSSKVFVVSDQMGLHAVEKLNVQESGVPYLENFRLVQFLEYIDVFCFEQSEFERHLAFPEKVGVIDKLILKQPSLGLPSCFRIYESRSDVFINQRTKDEFEKQGVTGIVYEPVEVRN